MAGVTDAPGIVVGVGVGAAAAAALEPAVEIPKQEAWAANPNRILDPGTLARLAAQGGITLGAAETEALRGGYGSDKLDALVYLSQTVPGFAEAMHLWRLGYISDNLMSHALTKTGLDQRYVQPILDTKIEELIGLGDIAYGIVRGILPAPAYVPVAPPTTTTNVKRFPQVNIDPEALAAKIGFSPEALQIMVGRSGLSMAPGMAAQGFFRGILAHDDYLLAIAEGDLRTEWGAAVLDVSREILTAHDYAELQLRGFLTADQRLANTAKHGMSDADSNLLYDVLGRAPSIRQTYIGLARGATYDGTPQSIPSPYLEAAQRSNLRPEWYDVAYQNRYSLPSAFVTRQLLKDGAIDAARAETIFVHSGWPPDLAQLVAQAYAPTGGSSADPHVTKASNSLWTTTHKSYVGEMIDQPTATTALTTLGVAASAQPAVFNLWNEERSLTRKQLTPAQIKKAYGEGATNPATGQPWTQQEALDALTARGYDLADATVLLEL